MVVTGLVRPEEVTQLFDLYVAVDGTLSDSIVSKYGWDFMVAWGTLIFGLLAFTALALALFRGLLATVVSQRVSVFGVIAIYWLATAVSVFSIWLAVIQLANYLYSTFPVLRVAAWDVGLGWVAVIGACLSVAIGFVFACGFTWRVWAYEKSLSAFSKH
ncbi:MAG: hypothetical protein LBE30_09905 [Comamonas sp.]|jgi:hypothetical protein|nr:hypothetical protein [Comamonas sp.]